MFAPTGNVIKLSLSEAIFGRENINKRAKDVSVDHGDQGIVVAGEDECRLLDA